MQHNENGPRSSLRGLIALNAILLLVLAAVSFSPSADAQGRGRGRGDYTMIAGGVNGAQADAVYILDTANQELVAITYDKTKKAIEGIGYANLARDAARAMSQRPSP